MGALVALAAGLAIWRAAPGPRSGSAEIGAVVALALAALVALAVGAPGPARWLALLWLWILLALGLSDLRCRRLPDGLTGALAVIALALAWRVEGAFPLAALGAGLVAAGAFWLLRIAYRAARGREGLGLGDVKMIFGIAAGTGLVLLPWVTLMAAVAALASAAVARALGREGSREMPFGTYLAGAAAVVWAVSHLLARIQT
jgi:leader peptidase (prepilin peptidase)/N-methyltransferase